MASDIVRQTVVIIPDRGNGKVEVSTFNKKWQNRMELLVEQGVATEVQTSVEGAREWEMDQSAVHLPGHKAGGRVWTEEQRDAQREAASARLAAAREERLGRIAAEKAVKAKAELAAAAAASKKGKKKVEPEPEPEPVKANGKKTAAPAKTAPASKTKSTPAPVVVAPVVARTGKSKDMPKADPAPVAKVAPKATAKSAVKATTAPVVATSTKKGKKVVEPEPEEDFEDDLEIEEDEELEDEEEEMEEVVVKVNRPTGRGGQKAR